MCGRDNELFLIKEYLLNFVTNTTYVSETLDREKFQSGSGTWCKR